MKTIHATVMAAIAAGAGLGGAPALAGSYTFTTLALPSGADSHGLSRAGALNDNDQIAGTFMTKKEIPHGFFWSNGTASQVDNGAHGTELFALSNAGLAAGIYCPKANCPGSGFSAVTYDTASGVFQTLTVKQKLNPRPHSINLAGTVAGMQGAKAARTQVFVAAGTGAPAILTYPGAKANEPDGIDDAGLVLGEFQVGSLWHPFTYQNGTYTDIDPPNSRNLTGEMSITSDGRIVGDYYDNTVFRYRIFTLIGGSYTIVDEPQLLDVVGLGSNGEIAGDVADSQNRPHGFVYVAGASYQIDPPGATQTQLISVNANGSLFGLAKGSAGNWYFIAKCAQDQQPCTQ
jgi:uncharacterized membrane protein